MIRDRGHSLLSTLNHNLIKKEGDSVRGNTLNLISEIDGYLNHMITADSERIVVATRTVVVNPNFLLEKEIKFRLHKKKLSTLIHLAIGSWYLGDLGYVLREDIRERSNQLCLEDKTLLGILLSSKTQMMIFLTETSLWHVRDFFGNHLPQLLSELQKLKWFLKKDRKKVSYPQRKRGYNDKGSRALDSVWKSARAFWKDTEDQLEKEKEEDIAQDSLDFLIGCLL